MNKMELARIIKGNRMLNNELLTDVANSLNVKHFPTISKWESGLHAIKPFMLKGIAEHYGLVDLDNDEVVMIELKLQELFSAIYYKDFGRSKTMLDELHQDYEQHIRSTPLVITFIIYEFFHYAYSEQYESSEYIAKSSIINKLDDLLTREEVAIYKDMLSINYYKSMEFEKAIDLLDGISQESVSIEVKSLIEYHKAMIYRRLGSYKVSRDSYNCAFLYFSKKLYTEKMVSVLGSLAVLSHLEGDSEDAISNLVSIVNINKKTPILSNQIEIVLRNLAWIYTDTNEIAKAKYYLTLASKYNPYNIHLLFNYLRIAYCEKDKVAFRHYYMFVSNVEIDSDETQFLVKFSNILNELLESKQVIIIDKVLRLYQKYKDSTFADTYFLSELIIELLNKKGRHKELCKLLSEFPRGRRK